MLYKIVVVMISVGRWLCCYLAFFFASKQPKVNFWVLLALGAALPLH